MHSQVAFLCKSCGHLHHADHAGEHSIPHACAVCDAGVIHDPEGVAIGKELADPNTTKERIIELGKRLATRKPVTAVDKQLVPDNWEVLADCMPERLAELGLEPHHVCRHVPHESGKEQQRRPQSIERGGEEAAKVVDKA